MQPTRWTHAQLQKIIGHIQRKAYNCPSCGAEGGIAVSKDVVVLRATEVGSPVDCAVETYCRECGHIRLFNAKVIGLELPPTGRR